MRHSVESIDTGVVGGRRRHRSRGRGADKTLGDLAKQYGELVDLARRRRITAEQTAGGIASVSSPAFGLDWGTPIPLPDQTLSWLGAGKKSPLT